MNHFTPTGILVRNALQVAFALQRFLVQSLTSLADSSVVVSIVLVVVVVVSIVVVGTARQTRRRHQWCGWKAVSVIVLFVGSRRSMLGTRRIGENASVDSRGRAVGTHVVHLVLSISIVIVVLVLATTSSFFVHGTAFSKLIQILLSFLLSFLSLGTKVHSLVGQALVHAIVFISFASLLVVLVLVIAVLIVVVIVFGVSIVVAIVVAVLTAVLALVLRVLAFVFVGLLLRFLESFDKFSHFHNVFSGVTAASAVAVGTKPEFSDEVASKALLALERRNAYASIEFEGSLSHP